MDMMRRHYILANEPRTEGGIVVFRDNCYVRSSGKYTIEDSLVSDPDWCVIGILDSGSTGSKSYEYYLPATSIQGAFRLYNDLTAESVDWWAASSKVEGATDTTKTTTTAGRYIIWSIYKPKAADYFCKISGTNTYLFKGNNVT